MSTQEPKEPVRGDLDTEARRLAANWERRARSEARDYYVSSHPGWNQPEVWAHQAEVDVTMFMHQLDPAVMRDWDLLEVGCGVGRLVPELAKRAKSYTGFDIAPGMVESAKERNAAIASARFFVSDGTGPPAEARDRLYDLILVFAVFIHCPRTVIASNIQGAYALLKPGGQLRFQIRADPSDLEGVQSLEAAAALHAQMDTIQVAQTPTQQELMEEGEYMGDMFRYAEVEPWLVELTGGNVQLIRVDLASHYGWIEKPR